MTYKLRSHKAKTSFVVLFMLFALQNVRDGATQELQSLKENLNPEQNAAARLPLMRHAPTVDGVISEDEWADATRIVGFQEYLTKGVLHPRMATGWFGCDGKRVYVGVKSELPLEGKLLAEVTKKDGAVSQDDGIEIWLAPRRLKTPTDQRYFQFIGNSIGTIADIAFGPGGTIEVWDGDWQFQNTLSKGWWNAEASVSLESLGATAEDLKNEWRVNVCRSWQQPLIYSSWGSGVGGFANRDTMVRVQWDDEAPVVQMISLGDLYAGRPQVIAAIRNPGVRPIDVKVNFDTQPAFMPTQSEDKAITIPPGTTEKVEFTPIMPDMRTHVGVLRVTSVDGNKVYFNRAFSWEKKPERIWLIARNGEEVEFSAGYYPYYRKVRARVNFSALKAGNQVNKANIAITHKGQSKVLARGEITSFKNGKGEAIITTPDLPNGHYLVTLKLQGGQGVPTRPFEQEFERKKLEWEHNTLGKARVVIPPFTPLIVQDQKVESILRSHTMNQQGLWDQVVAKGEPILVRPMRLEAQVADKNVSWKFDKLQFTEKSPDRVQSVASYAGGPVQVKATSQWDYDGMMKMELEIAPRGSQEIQSLDLLIPVRKELATLMHAAADQVLSNYSGRIPSGEGVVWDSSKTVRSGIYGTWIPYIWIGEKQRGVSFFSETDRDWVLDDNKPALDLVRSRDALTLRVHLINNPTKLDRRHRIVFGLQATPVKPQPKDWRSLSFYEKHPNATEIVMLNSATEWGGISDFGSLYPRNRDFRIYEKFREALQTGRQDMEFVNAWQAKSKALGQPNWNALEVGMRKMQPGRLISTYMDARGGSAGEETRFFAAEKFHDGPVPSFVDCAVFYIKKMLETYSSSVFLDEVYLKSNTDTISSEAYVRPDGNVQPAVGLWGMRELTKRIAVMCYQMGKPNLTMLHMTNCQIIPRDAFAAISLDWEAGYGGGDFQEKFSPDFIFAESSGMQAGLVPVVLGGALSPEESEKARLSRTQFGVTTVHELKILADGRTTGLHKAYNALYDFGYGLPDCKYYRYWEGQQPLRIEGPENKALVVSRPAKTLILVTDYSDTGGDFSLLPDVNKLGLKGSFTAKDAETGEALPVTGGKVLFPLKKHDFRMIVLE